MVKMCGMQWNFSPFPCLNTRTVVLNKQFTFSISLILNQSAEITKLKKQMSNMVKTYEESNITRADSVNRLTKSLEESQRQCSELLQTGTYHYFLFERLNVYFVWCQPYLELH